jgi:hypothetical protein
MLDELFDRISALKPVCAGWCEQVWSQAIRMLERTAPCFSGFLWWMSLQKQGENLKQCVQGGVSRCGQPDWERRGLRGEKGVLLLLKGVEKRQGAKCTQPGPLLFVLQHSHIVL